MSAHVYHYKAHALEFTSPQKMPYLCNHSLRKLIPFQRPNRKALLFQQNHSETTVKHEYATYNVMNIFMTLDQTANEKNYKNGTITTRGNDT